MKKVIFIFLTLLFSCSDQNSQDIIQEEWSVDRDNVTGSFSLFPLALNPDFLSVSETTLDDNALVGVVQFGSTLYVYPYSHFFSNEIINHNHNGFKYALSYCPITKSAIAFQRESVFRASGHLFNDNLTPWDEGTETVWSQMLGRGINGVLNNRELQTIPVVETKWKTIKDYFPHANVVESIVNARVSAPPDNEDDNQNDTGNAPEQGGELVYGIINNSIEIFKYNSFPENNRIDIISQSNNYIVYGNSSHRVINAFKVSSFDLFQVLPNDEFPYILRNNQGVKYNIFGIGTNGSVLQKPDFSYVASWNGWSDFYTNFTFNN